MIAYLPARGGSKRIPRKNIREIGGRPVLSHVIAALKTLNFVEHVCVSSDDGEILRIASDSGAVTLEARAADLADDHAGFVDLLERDTPRFLSLSQDDNTLLFVLPTSVLIPPLVYQRSFERFRSGQAVALVSVNRFEPSPFRALCPADDGLLEPLFRDVIKKRTQDMPVCYVDAGCFYFLKRREVLACGGILQARPAFEVLSGEMAIDVDTEDDWQRLEEAWSRRAGRREDERA